MCVLKMKFLSSTVQKLSSEQTHRQTDRQTDRQTNRQTDSTEIITYPHTLMVKMSQFIIEFYFVCYLLLVTNEGSRDDYPSTDQTFRHRNFP